MEDEVQIEEQDVADALGLDNEIADPNEARFKTLEKSRSEHFAEEGEGANTEELKQLKRAAKNSFKVNEPGIGKRFQRSEGVFLQWPWIFFVRGFV